VQVEDQTPLRDSTELRCAFVADLAAAMTLLALATIAGAGGHSSLTTRSADSRKPQWGKKWGKNQHLGKTIIHKKIQSPLSDWIS
jgi:hypothetical protein